MTWHCILVACCLLVPDWQILFNATWKHNHSAWAKMNYMFLNMKPNFKIVRVLFSSPYYVWPQVILKHKLVQIGCHNQKPPNFSTSLDEKEWKKYTKTVQLRAYDLVFLVSRVLVVMGLTLHFKLKSP